MIIRSFFYALLSLSLALPLVLSPEVVRAAEAKAAEVQKTAAAAELKCEFAKEVSALRSAESNSNKEEVLKTTSTTASAVEDPLEVRRELLVKIINCALGETESLKTGIKKVSLTSKDAEHLAAVLLERIDVVSNKYESSKTRAGSADEKGLREVAREVAAARKDLYLPLWDMSRAYVVWNTNRELVERAGKRVEEVKQTLLARKISDQGAIADLTERASVSFLRSKEADHRAFQSIERFERDNVLTYFKETLDHLHGVYQSLLSISGAVRNIR